jgi:hypothetical protein
MRLKIITNTKCISVGGCWFCEWKPIQEDQHHNAEFVKIDGAVYVFCPKCGYELQDAQFLIGENV